MARRWTSLLLQLGVLVQVMLCLPPRDWGGSYGRDKPWNWVYECRDETCSYTVPRRERAIGGGIPRCKFGHGELRLANPKHGD